MIKFIESYRQSPSSEPTKHWVSKDRKFTVSRFIHKKMHGAQDHSYIKPTYSVYHHPGSSRSKCIATSLKTWKEVIKACEDYLTNAQ